MKKASVFLVIVATLCTPLWASKTTLTGSITDSQGNGLNGSLLMTLPVPASDGTTAVMPGTVSFQVSNGTILGTAQLYDVATLQPQGLFYSAEGYDNAGNLVFYGNYVVTGASFNLGAATPTTVTTSNISYLTPIFSQGNNTFTGTNSFTGPNTFSNSVTFSGTPITFSGNIPLFASANFTNGFELNGSFGASGACPQSTGTGTIWTTAGCSIGGTPTFTAGAGAGTGPTITFGAGSKDRGGIINVTAGTTPTASATIVTVNFSQTYPNTSFCTISQANNATAALAIHWSVVTNSPTTFAIQEDSTALTNATNYSWSYTCNAY